MNESQVLKDCTHAFPGIEYGNHDYSAEALLADLHPKGAHRSDIGPRQTEFSQERGIALPDTLIAHAEAAKFCSREFNKSDNEKQMTLAREKMNEEVKGLLGIAEVNLAKNILQGRHEWVPVLKLEEPGMSAMDHANIAPPTSINSKEQALYSAIRKEGNMEAALRRDSDDPTHFWIVAGKAGDHGREFAHPNFDSRTFQPRVVD